MSMAIFTTRSVEAVAEGVEEGAGRTRGGEAEAHSPNDARHGDSAEEDRPSGGRRDGGDGGDVRTSVRQ